MINVTYRYKHAEFIESKITRLLLQIDQVVFIAPEKRIRWHFLDEWKRAQILLISVGFQGIYNKYGSEPNIPRKHSNNM